jgi:hypothetical protein
MNNQHEHFDLDRLKSIPITGVARRLGDSVRKAGVNHVTLCPWHEDHHPSLSLVEATGKNYCHCFSCGNGGDVISYAMQREGWTFQEACQWLSSTFGISTLQTGGYVSRPMPQPVAKREEPVYTYIPMEMVDAMVSVDNSLCRCLMHTYQPEAVEWLTEEYRIGCYSMNGYDDYTVFPNIDRKGRVCNLKIQHYDTDPQSPRFAHSDKGFCYWLGKMWVREGKLPQGAQFNSCCLFGEHLLNRYPDSGVALVESPKNALFGAIAFPQLTWVAVGSKGMLKRDLLESLRGRDVMVFPDCDGVEEWTQALKGMADLANFTVSDFCSRMAPEGQPKFDIADYMQQHAPIFL